MGFETTTKNKATIYTVNGKEVARVKDDGTIKIAAGPVTEDTAAAITVAVVLAKHKARADRTEKIKAKLTEDEQRELGILDEEPELNPLEALNRK